MFLVDAASGVADPDHLRRIRRMLAMRGDAPYLGVASPGRLEIYRIGLDAGSIKEARIDTGIPSDQKFTTFSQLSNERPGIVGGQSQWISQVVLRLLTSSIDKLKLEYGLGDEDAISLVGRALFARFLSDRNLLPASIAGSDGGASLFDSRRRAMATSTWLDKTFNGDFLPLNPRTFRQLPADAFAVLGDVLRRAPEGQLFLGWQERWDNLHFAHIPVGVLSQAYEHYLHVHAPKRQKQEGGYYTPRPIADLMVRGAFQALSRDMEVHDARVLDPAAGAGVFLLTAFRQLAAERWRKDGIRPNTRMLRDILYNQIVGFDVNEAALRFAALGLYLMSIELDPDPHPVRKLRFKNLRSFVLRKLGADNEGRGLGSLGPEVGKEYEHHFDIVVGNPPWASGTKLPNWNIVESNVAEICRNRRPDAPAPKLPNEGLDLPFVWRAMEWAKPDGQIAFALHARLLFQQGDGMPEARSALFGALDVTAIVNGVELRQTKVWPQISAPFCLLYAKNRVPGPGAGFRLVSPRLETSLNGAGVMRIDAMNAEVIASEQVIQHPEILKVLFRGGIADQEIYQRIRTRHLVTLETYWISLFGEEGGRPRFSGNGYQKLRASSRIRKTGDGKPGVSAKYLNGLREITSESVDRLLVDVDSLPLFSLERIHDPRPLSLFSAPMLIVHKSPPADLGRIRVAVSEGDAVFNESYYGYSAKSLKNGERLVKCLSLLLSSKPALWLALITSGEFGFEREVVEKTTIDGLLVPRLEDLNTKNTDQLMRLFTEIVEDGSESAWQKVDALVAKLYGLSGRDLEVISDTLEFGLPFADNRRKAQAEATEKAVAIFCQTLLGELTPWAERFSQAFAVAPMTALGTSPWRTLQLQTKFAKKSKVDAKQQEEWHAALRLADSLAATEIVYPSQSDGSLWIGLLNQARYWTKTRARLVAQRIAWEHVDLLAGRSSH